MCLTGRDVLTYDKQFGTRRISRCTHKGTNLTRLIIFLALKRACQTTKRTATNRANTLQSRTSQGADADAARVRALAAPPRLPAFNTQLYLRSTVDTALPI
jgi:hypothetical protein